jgi:methionine-rich copper-binding protein CopC
MAKRIQVFALSFAVFAGLPLVVPHRVQANVSMPQLAQASTSAVAASGQRVQSEAGRFAVEVPTSLQVAPTTSTVNGTILDWTVSHATQGETTFAVAYTDLPLDLLALGQDAVIESLKTSPLIADVDWQALSNRGHRVTLGDLSGVEYLHLEAGQMTAVRFYLANRRLYAVMASSPDLPVVNQFLDSFAIDPLWQPFVSEAGGFTVNLPMAPVFTPQQVAYRGATLDWWQYVGYNLYAPDDRYGFAYVDVPDGVSTTNADALLSEVATQVLTDLDAPDLATTGTVIGLDRHPGRQYLLTHTNGMSYVLRLYLVDRRIYGLLAASQSLNNLDRFLSSFQVQ